MAVTAPPHPATIDRAGGRDSPAGGWLLFGIIALGILIRFPTIGEQSFWYDETVTHAIVAHGLGHVFSQVQQTESTPPLYYVLLWLWSRVFGTNEAGLRSFSALCGVLTIPLMWTLGRQLAGNRVGYIVALLTAVNPLLFWYSQEARAYALLVLLSAASLLALQRALDEPERKRLIVWGSVSALAIATHYFAVFLIAAEAAWLLRVLRGRNSITWGRIAAALAPPAVVGGALLPLAIHQDNGRASFIANNSGSLATRLAQFVKQDVVAYSEPQKVFISALALLLVAFAMVLLVRVGTREERTAVIAPLAIGLCSVLLAIVVAVVGTDYIITRNLLPSWPPLALVVAAGFGVAAAPRLGATALAALTAISIACIAGVIVNPLFQREDWRGAAHAMGRTSVPRAIVGGHLAGTGLVPYMSGLGPFPAAAAVQEVDVFSLIYRVPGGHEELAPPRPNPPPSLPGFTLVQRVQTRSYTVLRYRAPAPVAEQAASLLRLALVPNVVPQTVLIQNP
jgi:uncharacterized membrane protein